MLGPSLRILVVGAGIAGLAAARALRLAGFRPEVVDKVPASTVAGAGIYLPGNATRALRALDLDAPVRPYGEVVTRQRFLDESGRQLCEVDLVKLWEGVGECRALPRADLHRVMLSGAGGNVRHETEVTRVDVVAGETAKVEFGDGSAGEYDLVVGADGRRSSVRVITGLGSAAVPVGQVMYRSVVTGGPEITEWTAVLGRRAAFVVMPMGAGRLFCYADEAAAAAPPDGLARVREVFECFGGPVPAVLDAMEKVQVAVTDEVEVGNWSRGPVVLVGDAAHATAPTLAQGAAMAMEDAVVLADSLRRSASVSEALGEYERRRRPRTRWVLERTRDRDRLRDLAPSQRDPMLRRHGGTIFADHYKGLVGPH
jgi:2-polyprenyl-6-methoxyphenol hydroxylase-like FAD-dependent oxidoreductase